MPPVSRSFGQLHFEDLEPHRFEDLIRALIYEFRTWQKLEATGRTGSDEGFDARGWEAITHELEPDEVEDEDPQEVREPSVGTRQWLIQCKREKSITPKKLVGFLEDIGSEECKGLYGIVFAAACDFSKKSRDAFRLKCVEFGVTEFYLWGKGELEDMLVQPKNDHLLFAHFGISLVVRQRSLRAALRARLAIKRKAIRVLGKLEIYIRSRSFETQKTTVIPIAALTKAATTKNH